MALNNPMQFVLDELNGMIDSLDDSVAVDDMGRVLIELRDAVRDDQGAPRQAGTEQQVQEAEQVRFELERLGVATGVRALTPASAGHAVRLIVGDGSSVGVIHLEPQEAADLAEQLLDDAQDAIYADRAVRRG